MSLSTHFSLQGTVDSRHHRHHLFAYDSLGRKARSSILRSHHFSEPMYKHHAMTALTMWSELWSWIAIRPFSSNKPVEQYRRSMASYLALGNQFFYGPKQQNKPSYLGVLALCRKQLIRVGKCLKADWSRHAAVTWRWCSILWSDYFYFFLQRVTGRTEIDSYFPFGEY